MNRKIKERDLIIIVILIILLLTMGYFVGYYSGKWFYNYKNL